jgi:hypothetical protein
VALASPQHLGKIQTDFSPVKNENVGLNRTGTSPAKK